ncbi:Calmodulin-regulated spectrin-associated protein 3 [Merluccius polli]|uniref:Calmodulin-regulated spectrin-associated protein 3 n=1 Tax=Merluccius polli TaxID=89951 RepID=A0AA47P607_MERPO|nr:Calmodulin-regulated spectrin-associated protein 3 [Merluccius polli]
MVDASAMKKAFTVSEIKPLDQYDFNRAKICASVRWLLSKSYGTAENVPVELREPFYKDQYEQEHLKPKVSELLLSPELYCRAQALLAQAHGISLGASQEPLSDNSALLQLLTKKGFAPRDQDNDITEEDLYHTPIKTKAHLALMDALMSLAAKETVGRVKMAEEAGQMGAGEPWENALLFWVNRLNQKLRLSTEEVSPKLQPCKDLQPAQENCPSNRWYWKLVPIRYKKDKVLSKMTPTFPLVSGVKDLSNGCAVAAALHYYCPSMLPLEDVCLKDTMSVADSLYNLHLIKEFCESRLQSCCPLAVEDLLYAPPALHVNIVSFVAELLDWFEVQRPEFVQPIQHLDLTDVSGLLDCTSPVSGIGNSGSPSFIFKQPYMPISSPVSPESKTWGKTQISRPLSAVTFSIPFGLDSDVDVIMGNPIESFLHSSTSTDSLSCTAGIPAMTHVPYSPPEDLSHLVSASLPSQRSSSWGLHAYPHAPPSRDLPTIEEALAATLQAPRSRGGGGRRGNMSEEKEAEVDSGVIGGRWPEPRLRPEGAPAGFFLHSLEGDYSKLSSFALGHSGMFHQPVGGELGVGGDRQGRGDRRERPSPAPDTSHDDDSVLQDGSVDSSEASDDLLPRNVPGNLRPIGSGHHSIHGNSGSPRMTNFAERRDNRRRQSSAPGGEESTTPAQTPTTPGTPHTPTTPAGVRGHQDSLGPRGPKPGSEAWDLAARLEEKRKSIEAQKRRIEAIFAKHRQRLGKTAFLQLKREQGEGGSTEGAQDDKLTLEERLTRMEEELKLEEQKEEKEKNNREEGARQAEGNPTAPHPSRLEKQVTFSVESCKTQQNEGEKEKGKVACKAGGAVLEDYNGVVQKLSEALQSLQKDMQKLTEQQQQLMVKPRTTPKSSPKTTPKSTPRGHPRTPPQTPPCTPTKTPLRGTSKAWVTPPCPVPSSLCSSSRQPHVMNSASTPPKTPMSSSCPAPRTKLYSSTTPRSPKHHPRPSELKFPPFTRVLTLPQNVDTLPHLRRVSPSKCQVQTSSSFRIGGPQTPIEPTQPLQPPQQPEETASETGSSETPTQFSLELENEEGGVLGDLVALPCILRRDRSGVTGGSSSGAPSECSFGSETISLSAVFSMGGGEVAGGGGSAAGRSKASRSSLVGPEGGSDEPTDEGQEFSSDSMSERMETALESARKTETVSVEPISGEPVDLPENVDLTEHTVSSERRAEDLSQIEALQPVAPTERGPTSGIGFFFEEEVHSEGEMAQRRTLLLERQQRRVEEVKEKKKWRQWHEKEREEIESRPGSSEERQGSPCLTPPLATTSPFPTPPAIPVRWGEFTRGEYSLRHQLKVMADLGKVLQQKPANHGRASSKKTRPRARPRSVTRAQPQLSQSLNNGIMAEFEAVRMRVSTSKSEAMVLCWKRVDCSLWVGSELLPQVKEFKYLGVLFTRLWVVTEKTRLRIAAEMRFLRRVAGLILRDRVRSSDIRRELRVEPLLLCVERSQLRWVRMPPGCLPLELTKEYSHSSLNLAPGEQGSGDSEPAKKPPSGPNSPLRCISSSRPINPSMTQNAQTDCDVVPNGTPPAPEYTGPKLFKEPSFKSNKFIIHNALSRCCLAGKVNETQKNKIVEEMEKSPANHFLILFRDASCQFRGLYTMNPDTQELVRLAGVGPRTIGSNQVESIYKYSSDRKQFSAIPSKTVGISVDAFTIPGPLWHGGGVGGSAGGSRRASTTKKAALSK